MAEKEFTLSEISSHTTKKDLYIVIHDKVYDSSSFVDEHPGGEEVMLDVGGQDATEAFEDVGHSDEAREILDGLLLGKLKREAGDPKPAPSSEGQSTTTASTGADLGSSGMGGSTYMVVAVGALVAYAVYYFTVEGKK